MWSGAQVALQALGHANVTLGQPALDPHGVGAQPTLVVLEAVLEKGDVLLLPAHWLHYVEALNPLGSAHTTHDVSVSMNLWTPSKEELLLNQLMAPPQPWPDGVNLQAETLCVQLLLRTVLIDSAPALQRYLHPVTTRAPFFTATPSVESARDTDLNAAAEADPSPVMSSYKTGESSSAGEPPASTGNDDDSAKRKAAKGRRARRQKQHKQQQQSERKSSNTTQSLPSLAAAEAEQVVAAFLRQLLSHKGYDLEQQQMGIPRPQPPSCVSPAEVQSTVLSSGMPKEWVEAIVQRAKVVAQVFLQSAANGAPGGINSGADHTTSGVPLMQAETVAVHIESYLEVYAMNVVQAGGAIGEWPLSVGPFLRSCVCGRSCEH